MNTYPTEKIRNVLLFGHQGTGKTALAEALLFLSGATTRMGKVEDGNTVCDFEPEEVKKQLSVSLALAPVEWKDHKINILDSPGYADFIAETQAALRVADLAILVVSAVDGIEVQHEILWEYAKRIGVPRLVFINKLDRERASFSRTLEETGSKLGGGFAPFQLPLGEEHDFGGLADVLHEKAYRYDSDGKGREEELSGELASQAKNLHTQIIESVAESDDSLLEKYLEGEELTEKEVITGLAKGLVAGTVFPVVAGSATKLIGIDLLLDFIVDEAPSPADREPTLGKQEEQEVERAVSVDEPLSAFVFKTVTDPYVGRISLFKVISGKLRPDSTIHNVTQNTDERIGQVFTLRGKTQESLSEVPAGDIAAVAKLGHTHSSDTFADKSSPIAFQPLEAPDNDRSLAKAIEPKTKGDEDKLMIGLSKLQEEDSSLHVERNPETKQTLLWGTGEAHLDVTIERLSRKFGVGVNEVPLRIPYRETIKKPGKGLGRHVKQSGGHGQYGICNLEVEPLPHGAGFEFEDKIFGGAIPNQWIPSVAKGVEKAMSEGVVAGYPMVDVKVRLVDGKFHAVDSSDMAFQLAGSLGLKEAAQDAGVTLLEPIVDLEVMIPDSYLGDVMGDLNSKRGKILGTEAIGSRQLVKAKVPLAEVARYAIDLRSMTGGQGTFRMTQSHYEEVPAHLTDKIVAESKAEKETKS
ncbi:MAG: elongation factor G [Actinobacteria bacterium]|nr:elongation factor G [Actinomycetota bacterium]